MKNSIACCMLACATTVVGAAESTDDAKKGMREQGVLTAEFVYESAPFPQCHASTICEADAGLVAAWFGGEKEGAKDVGIWLSRKAADGVWSEPVQVADGRQQDGTRYPCWNPVLFQPERGPLLLFYKVGPKPDAWWGMLTTSSDAGKTWSASERLPENILGPVKNKPEMLDGILLCASSTEHDGWRVHFERTSNLGKTWDRTEPIADPDQFSAIQPAILKHPGDKLQALCRSKTGGHIVDTWSSDAGKTWSPLKATSLPNPNSGIDAVTLRDGLHVAVYNHVGAVAGKWGGPRSPLNVAVSKDGQTWQAAVKLESEPGEFSYPAVIQTRDDLVHITYTWNRRRIKHVVVDPGKFVLRPIADGRWPD